MSRVRSIFVSLFVIATALATSGNAAAYCRTKACDTDPSYGDVWDEVPDPETCVRNAQGCYVEGTPLYWPKRCISFGVQRDGSESSDIDYETADAVIQEAFDKWAAVACDRGAAPSFRIVNKGEIACARAEYNQDAMNANVFLFRDDDWPYEGSVDTLALTTITYNVETAEIYDADVEMNSRMTTFTTTDDPLGVVSDLPSVVTHEVGHFLGLSHSADYTAVMRGIGYTSGSTELRTLTPDDIAGICEVFPPDDSRGEGDCEPRHGFSRECGEPAEEKKGCAIQPASKSDARYVLAFAAFALALVLRRKRAPH